MMGDQPAGTLIDVLDPATDQVDRDAARRVARRLRADDGAELVVRTAGGQMEHLPRGVANLMASMLEEVAEGHTVALVSDAEEVSTSAAAAFLGVSRPHVVKLIDTGLLPARMAGTHRRVRMTDLVAYKRTAERRREFLDELAAEAQELGLYDDPPTGFVRQRTMGRGEPIGAVLDANVLYSAFLRDVLLRLAAAGLYRPHWTERIHEEWTRNLLVHRQDLSPTKLSRTRAGMDAFFPDALVMGYEELEGQFSGVSPEDRHVAAAALKAGAAQIVTQNLRDFPPSALQPHGLVAREPDEFVRMLVTMESAAAHAALEEHRRALSRPSLTPAEYRGAFIRNGLSRSAALLWP